MGRNMKRSGTSGKDDFVQNRESHVQSQEGERYYEQICEYLK